MQKMENDRIMVSISCITYNHEDYIADAIDSFLKQETNFEYEILIHDDASTDNTAQIIREYEKKYPNLIKPIYQKENQHSKGLKVGAFNAKRAHGKYVALCEGDDFWIDSKKLKIQVEFMENNPNCSMCVHGAYIVDAEAEFIIGKVRPARSNKLFSVGEIIEGGGSLFATNSVVCRRIFYNELPKFYELAPTGDRPFFIHLSLCGEVYYHDRFMSVYRKGVKESWSERVYSNIEKRVNHFNEVARMLDEVNKFTHYKYKKNIFRAKGKNEMMILLSRGHTKEAKTKYKKLHSSLSLKDKIIVYMKLYCPSFFNALTHLKSIKRKRMNHRLEHE